MKNVFPPSSLRVLRASVVNLPALFYAALALVWFYPLIFLHKIFLFEDPAYFYFPMKTFFSTGLHLGEFRQWCPDIGMGFPIHAEGQTAMCWPPNLLAYSLLPAQLAFRMTYPLLCWVICITTFWFLRLWKFSLFPALAGGVITGYSGFQVCHFDHLSALTSMSHFALSMALIEAGLQYGKSYLLGWAGVSGMQILAGHPQYFYYSFVACQAYLLWRWSSKLPNARPHESLPTVTFPLTLNNLTFWGVTTIISLLIGLVQVLPTLELSALSIRGGGLENEFANSHSTPPWYFLTYLFPNFFGFANPLEDKNWWHFDGDYWEYALYVGVVPLFLALAALWGLRKRGPERFFLGMNVVCHVVMMGKFTPVYELARHFLPGFGYLKSPGRLSSVEALCWAVLAARGWEALGEWEGTKKKRNFVITFSGLGVGLLASLGTLGRWVGSVSTSFERSASHWILAFSKSSLAGLKELEIRDNPEISLPLALKIKDYLHDTLTLGGPVWGWPFLFIGLGILLLGLRMNLPQKTWVGALLVLFVCSDLMAFGWNYNPVMPVESALQRSGSAEAVKRLWTHGRVMTGRPHIDDTMEVQREYVGPNMNLMWDFPEVKVFSPLCLKRYKFLEKYLNSAAAVDEKIVGLLATEPGLRHLCNISLFIADTRSVLPGAELVYTNQAIRLWQWKEPDHFATVVPEVRQAKSSFEIFNHLNKNTIDWDQIAYIEEPPPPGIGKAGGRRGTTQVTKDTWGQKTIQVNAPDGGWLVVSQTWYPGWKAWVNGKEEAVRITDYYFQGFPIPKGTSTVELRFVSDSFRLGLLGTALGLVLWVLGLWRIGKGNREL